MDGAYAMDKPEAIDLSHHLSRLSRERMQSPLKGMFKYMGVPGMTMLAGGLPSPDYFPFESISSQTLLPNTYSTTTGSFSNYFWSLFSSSSSAPKKTKEITIPKYALNPTPESIQLAVALQYGTAQGLPALQRFLKEFTGKVFRPAYSNWEVLLNAGSTDAWSKICTTLCDRGDGILCEEWTYPSALAAAWPNGFKPVALPMDGSGMTPQGLRDVLSNWNEEDHHGMKRPSVLYTVPVCQNPTGATMGVDRKKEIYKICCEFDVIVVEDDPYYFLQAGEYEAPSVRASITRKETDEEFLASLVPSYLHYDTQGRVIRIDTFSKTICPGSRLGWITANPLFCERMLRANECSTQAPCGFGQALITKLLVEEWKYDGYIRWLKGLKAQYRERRNNMVDALLDQAGADLDARQSSENPALFMLRSTNETHRMSDDGNDEKRALFKSEDEGQTLLSFVAPQGGMFVWLRVHFSNHPFFASHKKSTTELTLSLWELLAENHILVAPGNMFSGRKFGEDSAPPFDGPHSLGLNNNNHNLSYGNGLDEGESMFGGMNTLGHQAMGNVMEVEGDGFFRLAFSTASESEMRKAMKVIGKVTKGFFTV